MSMSPKELARKLAIADNHFRLEHCPTEHCEGLHALKEIEEALNSMGEAQPVPTQAVEKTTCPKCGNGEVTIKRGKRNKVEKVSCSNCDFGKEKDGMMMVKA